jgi:hypothetical protein
VLRAAVSEAAANHHVQALVDYAWRDSVGAAAANKESRLNTAITETVAQHLRVVAELAALTKVLDSISYPWVTVKGPALAELAYPDPALRPYVDLDVLVHPAGFGAAVAALEAYGAELFDQNWTLQRHRRRAESTFALPYGTWLDLHWHLVNDGNARDAFDWDMRTS